MATKKAGGTSKNGRDSNSKSLGLKLNAFSSVKKNSVLISGGNIQALSGLGVKASKNYSKISKKSGFVKFIKFNKLQKKYILVI